MTLFIRIFFVFYRICYWTKEKHIKYCRSIIYHKNNVIYFTFLMFPGTSYSLSKDNFWLFKDQGIENIYIRIFIQNIFQYLFVIYQCILKE